MEVKGKKVVSVGVLYTQNSSFTNYAEALKNPSSADLLDDDIFGKGANAMWSAEYVFIDTEDGGRLCFKYHLLPSGQYTGEKKVIGEFTKVPEGVNPEEWKSSVLKLKPASTDHQYPWFLKGQSGSSTLFVLKKAAPQPVDAKLEATAASSVASSDGELTGAGFEVIKDFFTNPSLEGYRTLHKENGALMTVRDVKEDQEATQALGSSPREAGVLEKAKSDAKELEKTVDSVIKKLAGTKINKTAMVEKVLKEVKGA